MRRSYLLLALSVLGCTPDYDLGKVEPSEDGGPQIEVSPSTLYFGSAEEGTELAQTFTITSVGDTVVTVSDVTIEGPDVFTLTSFAPSRLAPGESSDVVVTYTATGGEDVGQALVTSEDADSPHIVVLNGGGLVPELTIDPAAHDFGYVEAGSTDEATFTLTNTGGATLDISAISTTESVFAWAGDAVGTALEPGESTTVTVTYAPTDGSSWSGFLQVGSTDLRGVQEAALTGSGAVDQPIAVCEATPDTVEAIRESTTWRGNESYDPSGAAITDYAWTLVSAPSGSTARMPSGTGPNRSGFTPDVVGTYLAELVVTNEFGERSEPCTASLEAIPGGDLWIEMFWTRSGDDMDLHLLSPTGSLESNQDCYYANCTYGGLDWGTRGDSSDNPSLDLDDIPGTGPENINIDDPQSGTFSVYVHDYPGSVYEGNNDVTVNIYIGGLLEWTDTRNINREDYYEPFAEIDWPAGTVTSL
ncbi:MAG: choice-of-anchor D domain-containing protein [Myxococcota bacterium]